MTTFIQAIALAISLVIIIFVVKWQVNDDIKKMEKRLDDTRKEINKKAKVMSKDITEEILLKAGFNKVTEHPCCIEYFLDKYKIVMSFYKGVWIDRRWTCSINQGSNFAMVDIKTMKHFNMLMDIMGIDFKLKEE